MQRKAMSPRLALPARLAFAAVIVSGLVAGVAGGLARAGLGVAEFAMAGQAVRGHAFLMVCCFLGTVIGIERAVAARARWAFGGPLATGLSGLLLLAGQEGAAALLCTAGSAVFVCVNLLLLARQRAAHTVVLLLAALAWGLGSALQAGGVLAGAVVPLWLAFLVLTIAAERLEMARLMKQQRGAGAAMGLALALVMGGALLSGFAAWGGVAFGLGLAALSLWLLAFDIARRTVFARGLSRYMALCLLLGYGWLCVAGLAWVAMALGWPCRDVALHALALGFVFSMIFGHAPVILPAVARVKLRFSGWFYLPLALLHASLLIRFLPAGGAARPLQAGALLNAAAIAAFVAVAVGSAGLRTSRPAPARS